MLKDESFGKEEQLREYFPLSSVTGLFDLASRVFSIEIKDQTQSPKMAQGCQLL